MTVRLNASNGATVDYIHTVNTRDGNPRRGWAITYRVGGVVTARVFIDEGYVGFEAIRQVFTNPELVESGMFPSDRVRVAEYDEWFINHRFHSFRFATNYPAYVIDNSSTPLD